MAIKCDVLVVGAGPAGLSAARSTAKRGLKTIVIEEHEEVGIPVQCGEGIGEYLLSYLPIDIPKEQLIWRIEGMLFWSEEICIERKGKFWSGYSIDREKFDKWLAKLASVEGAEIWTSSKLVNMECNEIVDNVTVIRKKKSVVLSPKVIIGADGSNSTVLKLLGLYNPKKGDLAEVYSWEMKGMELYKPNLEQIFIGDFAPGGYAYIFPKGSTVANVGVGGLFPERKMEDYFDEFLEIPFVKRQVKKARLVKEKSKKAVWNDIAREWLIGNVVLAGDAANQNLKPFVEGILPSVICGDIAGKIASRLVDGELLSHDDYLLEVKKKLGIHLETSKILQRYIFNLFLSKDRERHLKFFKLMSGLVKPDELLNADSKRLEVGLCQEK
ncbi:MAG: hypothetical protein DRN00_02005 [Thermoplasmata archaeon]|nr:MAG: hypothetical protein DRN03_00950 [Thermoplasmata archaeon]RLF39392.1 MAG: hypothetical protein DRN00_02005 [Thermoplasmata archaeon]